ncbi:DUF6473 family protein [Roseovarius nanhaiticus]|uniref:DUF6473 domain-containing protein n=1 Tax=Roseovarius nanhaiticus TaxID=573024 RepID=A0A1N7FWQ0_9RHOB|nr:DUF6473 family protein [Roseovarius nanhaiticus]SEK43410.1 hypothetical protein SAMN05216208_0696 [Roseovarius nanhaiticus]SIS04761.1 hypothetical protein SAMN05421666_1440 [Roseovarius nanhaiticus]
MAYEKLEATPLDYMPCRYGTSKLLFRGPARDLEGRYIAFLGGTETYGRFIQRPFPALAEDALDLTCVNLGWPNAGLDVLLHDSEILRTATRSELVVLQVLGAQNMSNRYFTVHPRRNDRFVQASALLRGIFPEVDFTEFHFTRHMLGCLALLAPDRFTVVRRELQDAWIARMKLVLSRIDAPVLLLWMSAHPPQDCANEPAIGADPAFVTRRMLRAVTGTRVQLVDATLSAQALGQGSKGMMHSQFDANAAAELPGPAAHAEVAQRLIDAIKAQGKR